jgi:hypothetical protein
MPKYSPPENLTGQQSEALEKAAFLIISARKEAAAVLARAGVPFPDDEFGTSCHAHIEAFGTCPYTNYMGDGGTCLNRITLDPGASAPFRSCGHPASKHSST